MRLAFSLNIFQLMNDACCDSCIHVGSSVNLIQRKISSLVGTIFFPLSLDVEVRTCECVRFMFIINESKRRIGSFCILCEMEDTPTADVCVLLKDLICIFKVIG